MSNIEISSARPVFVLGAPRSGTTLLQYILKSHPNISIPSGESHFIVPLFRDRKIFGDLTQSKNLRRVLESIYKKSASFLNTDLHGFKFEVGSLANEMHEKGVNSVPSLVNFIFSKNAIGEGKMRWGDKTPYYVRHMRLLSEMFPNAQFIHIIRDGRDVAVSTIKRKTDFMVFNYFFAAKYWQFYVDEGQRQGRELEEGRYHELKYEDLIRDTEGQLRTICDFLGEEYFDSLLDYVKSGGNGGSTHLLSQPVDRKNSGKWKKHMNARQINTFERVASKSLSANGYQLSSAFIKPFGRLFRVAYRLHNEVVAKYYQIKDREKYQSKQFKAVPTHENNK